MPYTSSSATAPRPNLHLTARYVVALVIIAILLVTGMVMRELHHRRHSELHADGEIISRQLRIVNRTILMAEGLASISNPDDRLGLYRQYQLTVQEMGSYVDQMDQKAALRPARQYLTHYIHAAQRLAAVPYHAFTADRIEYQEFMRIAKGAEYTQAQTVLSEYKAKEEASLRQVMFMERSILGFALLTLLLEGLFIFRPMVKAVHRAQEHLLALNRMKSEFLANMSHEIRTPINAIFGMGELLTQSELTPKQRGQVDTLMNAADGLLTIIDDLLDFSKLEAGRIEIEQVPFDMHSAAEDVAELLATKAREKRLEVIVRYMPGTPQFVIGDPGRVRQVLMNLVSNAIKFTEHGYVLITVEKAEETDLLKVTVEDTGIGIAASKLGNIFDKFAQVDGSSTRRYGGTGLGLSICYELTRLMGGNIGVASTEGRGSSFWFTVRLKKTDRVGKFEPSHGVLTHRRVLVVDDIEANRALLLDSLNRASMQVVAVPGGKEAIRELRRAHEAGQPYDLAVVDYLMPEMNGDTLVRAIRNDDAIQQTPIIILSSAEEKGFIKTFATMKVAAYLSKPARRNQLLDVIAMVLEAQARGQNFDMLTVHATEAMRAKAIFDQDKPLSGIRILLTEDNRINREFTTEMLATMGCTVDHAENGKIAVEKCTQNRYDIILMDCQMPVMDGFEAAQTLQAMRSRGEMKETPVIALTANAMEGDRERCLRAGMHDYLTKPVRRANLESMLVRWLENLGEQHASLLPAPPVAPIASAVAPVPVQLAVSQPTPRVVPLGIDPQAMEETRQLVGDKFGLIAGYFLEDATRYMQDIERAAGGDGGVNYVAAAHTLKSSAKQFGLLTLSDIARRIEEIGRSPEGPQQGLAAIAALVEPMRRAFTDAHAYLTLEKTA